MTTASTTGLELVKDKAKPPCLWGNDSATLPRNMFGRFISQGGVEVL